LADNPSFYDGQVFVLRDVWQSGSSIAGTLSLERFSAFLYWRDGLTNDRITYDGFCTALIRSEEGHVMAVRASAGTLNAGRVYLPGGFIDARDALPDGTVDLDVSVTRELAEETGLDTALLHRQPGYIVARSGQHCCFCIVFRAPFGSEDLRALMLRGAQEDKDGELSDIIAIKNIGDLPRYDVIDHSRLVIASVLEEPL